MPDHFDVSSADPATVCVVEATLDDMAQVAPLFDAYRQFYGAAPDVAGAERFLEVRLAREESVIFVARQASVVGFAQLYPSFSSVAMRRTFILNDLFVVSERRGRGIGRRLISAAAAHAAHAGAAALEIATQNENRAALALYESVGFARDTAFTHLTLMLED